MATVVRAPRYTYPTQADGSLEPYTERGWVDVPASVVSFFEDSTGALLGTAVASSTADVTGPMPGWYPYACLISSWSSVAGVFLPTMAGAGGFAAPTLSALVPLPTMGGKGGMGALDYTSSSEFILPAMGGRGGFNAPSITAVVGLPTMAGKGGFVAPTLEAGGGGDPPLFSETFNDNTLGQFTGTIGSPTASGGKLALANSSIVRAPVAVSRGCYIEARVTVQVPADDTASFTLKISDNSDANAGNGYSVSIAQGDYEGTPVCSVGASRWTGASGPSIGSSTAPPASTAERLLRIEFPAAGGVVVKLDGTTYVTSADNVYGSFAYLHMRVAAGYTTQVNDVTVGAL